MAEFDPSTIATIYANNQAFTAWESVMVKREFGNGISTFQFTAAEGSYGPNYRALNLQPGDPVTISLGGAKAFTGWCTLRTGAYGPKEHQLIIAGQSKTVDLTRASAVVKPGSLNGSTFEQAVNSVLAPHGISLSLKNAPPIISKAFKALAIQYGETVAEFASRLAMHRGLFLTDDVNGNLVGGQANPAATSVATLVEGQNIKSCRFKLEDPSACSWNKLQGVSQTIGDDSNWPPRAFSATSTSASVRPNLYRLFVAEHPGDAEDTAQRVTHEALRAEWQTIQLAVEVFGWFRPDGQLWATAPDDSGLVSVFSPMVFPTANGMSPVPLGIQGITFLQDSENGTTTTLDLVKQNALTQAPTAGVQDPGGSAPQPATPDTPDYQGGGMGT